MTSFSERLGITQPKTIQIDALDMELRNSLWNVCRRFFFIPTNNYIKKDDMYHVASMLYNNYYKLPVETCQTLLRVLSRNS